MNIEQSLPKEKISKSKEKISSQESQKQVIDKKFLQFRELFKNFIDIVDKRYDAQLSDFVNQKISERDSNPGYAEQIKNKEKEVASLKDHYKDVLKYCIKIGLEIHLPEEDIKKVFLAGIFHDATKLDSVPDNIPESVKNIYNLVNHGNDSANYLAQILEKDPGFLNKISSKYTQKDSKRVIEELKDIIKNHMGPHPGFMTMMLDFANKSLVGGGFEPIVHNYPETANEEAFLTADMSSLADANGRQKILNLRKNGANFIKQDEGVCADYAKYGINLSLGEAAMLSAHQSALEAVDMIRHVGLKKSLESLVEESKSGAYKYGDDIINYREVLNKKSKKEQEEQKIQEVKNIG